MLIAGLSCSSSPPNDGKWTQVGVNTHLQGVVKMVQDGHGGLYLFAGGSPQVVDFDGTNAIELPTAGIASCAGLSLGSDGALYAFQGLANASIVRLLPGAQSWEVFSPPGSVVNGLAFVESAGTVYAIADGHMFYRGPGDNAWIDALPQAKNPLSIVGASMVAGPNGEAWYMKPSDPVFGTGMYVRFRRSDVAVYPDPFAEVSAGLHTGLGTFRIDANGTHWAYAFGVPPKRGPVFSWTPPAQPGATVTTTPPQQVSDGSCSDAYADFHTNACRSDVSTRRTPS
jgi:hypothetical protein